MFQPLKPLSDDIRRWIADNSTADVSALRPSGITATAT